VFTKTVQYFADALMGTFSVLIVEELSDLQSQLTTCGNKMCIFFLYFSIFSTKTINITLVVHCG
jgi:hypothetical protein